MTTLRRLVYRFLSLSYLRRWRVAEELGLVAEEDEALSDLERFRRVLDRAREQGKLAALWNAVSRQHGDESTTPNPFVDIGLP